MFKIAITLMIFSSLLLVEVADISAPPPPGGRRKREFLLKLATQQLITSKNVETILKKSPK